MKVYLAGKITGDSNYREKFAAAAGRTAPAHSLKSTGVSMSGKRWCF